MTTSSGLLAALNKIDMLATFDVARRDRTGILATASMGDPMRPNSGYKGSWIDAYKGADSITVNGELAAGATTLVHDASDIVRKGMMFTVPATGEVIYVSGVTSTTEATIVRSIGAVAAGVIADNAVLVLDSKALPENSTGEDDEIWQPETVENYFQTIDTQINMSRRALSTLQHGDTNNLSLQVAERMRQMAISMDRMLINGQRFSHGSGDDLVSVTGGMRFYNDIASGSVAGLKSDALGAALTQAMINNLNEVIVTQGGTTDSIAVSVAKARDIHAIVSANYSANRLSDWTADEGSVFQLPTDMPLIGSVNNIVVDTNLRDTEIAMYNSADISVIPMEGANGAPSGNWQTKDATSQGQDGESVRVLGDFMMEIRQSKANMGFIHNIQA